MDMTLERDGSGVIGTLFQQIISDMKVGDEFLFLLVFIRSRYICVNLDSLNV